ncbi:inactive tyrosine-protein kinase PEAK1-like isoform X2 [Acropora muricata]|uniref:inactive tyrosine-protein kinase PEAK1-like isoform X2 n=1 Tax=Acropora muricata TaxID=159855 RepID=UPI0034E6017D
MSACNNFVEQLWRKGKCSNCFQSKERHQNTVRADADVRKEEVINSHSQGNQAFQSKKISGLFKEENDEEKTILESANMVQTIAPSGTRDDKVVTGADGRKTEQGAKSLVGIKPKPMIRPKPRVPSGTVDSEKHVISCDENPLKSEDTLSDSIEVEDSPGKSHNRPRCNAKFAEKTEPLFSKPDDDLEVSKRANNKANIEPVSDRIVHDEECIREVDDSTDPVTAEQRNLVKISSKNDIDDITENERELLNLKIENDSGSDLDEYVPMKRSIILFTDEPGKEQNALKTDHVVSNTKESHGRNIMTCEPRTVTASGSYDSEVDEENEQSSRVLEFRNPLCFIANEIEMDDNERRNDTCDKLNPNEISSEFNSAKPFYVNGSGSTCRRENGSNNHNSEYENTRSSSGNNSSNGASGDVAARGKLNEEDIMISSKGTPDVLLEENGYVVMESSGTSNSSLGSSIWDSNRVSDFQESSCEGLHVEKASGKLNTGNDIDKPHCEILKNKLSNVQTVSSEKCDINTDLISENSTPKHFTKPYKVVDIGTGFECPTTEDHTDVPPLPPKEKDLRKGHINEFKHHVYLEPSEKAPMVPEQGPPDEEKETVPTLKGSGFASSPPSPAIQSVVERSPSVRRVPAPRPRSRVPSQFGTMPKPAPRTSRIIADVPETENTEVQKNMKVNSPPIASSPTPPKSSSSQPVTPVKSISPSPPQTRPTRSSTFSGTHSTPTSATPAKAQPSPKSTLRRAFASMKKLGGKKKNRLSKTLEISAPIIANENIPGTFTQKEVTPVQTTAEDNSFKTQQADLVDPEIPKNTEASSDVASVMSTLDRPISPPYSLPIDALPTAKQSVGPCTPIMETPPTIGYMNFPLSKGGGTLEKPKKPPRVTKLVKPFHYNETIPSDSSRRRDEEPTYLQPNQDVVTLKMEAALANLNDAEILAETLSRVEQEKLGPLPAIPKPRQVRFHCEKPDASKDSLGDKCDPAMRPTRVVSPTRSHVPEVKDDSKSCPRLPSRPPNPKPALHSMRGRSQSFDSRSLHMKKTVVRSRSLSSSSGLEKRYNKILKLQLQTLEEMINSWSAELLPDVNLDLSDTKWSDYEVCGELFDIKCAGAVLVPVKCAKFWEGNKKLLAKVEYPASSSTRAKELSPYRHDMRVTGTVSHHVNISRVLTHFTDAIPGDVIGREDCDSYETSVSITDQIPYETVACFLKRTKEEHENDPETYEKKICLLLLQLLSAIDHLHREAVVHRDLKAENLCLLDCGLLVVFNFQHALQQVQTTRPSPFIISKAAADDLGGNWEHLPPEILTSPEEATLLNYEGCDTFAAGCLVYELLHRSNPFAVNRLLIQQDFDQSDLPPIPVKSQFSRGLCIIARQLLRRFPQERLSAGEALQMLQVLLWGPRKLEDESVQSAVSDWLESERAHTVAMIARNQMQKGWSKDEFVEMYMKCEFLVDTSADSVSYIYQQLDLDK